MLQINEEYRQLDRSPGALRRFGWTVGGVLLLLGAFLLWRARVAGWPMLIAGAAILLVALVAPSALKHFHRAWMTIALIMGWIMTNVILTLVFFLILTPIGFLQRLVGRGALDLGSGPSVDTYWQARPDKEISPADYERQF